MLSVFQALWRMYICFEIDSLVAFHVERSLVEEDPVALIRVMQGQCDVIRSTTAHNCEIHTSKPLLIGVL